jgi:hypothetical protein
MMNRMYLIILSSFLFFSCSKSENVQSSLDIVKGTFDIGTITNDTIVNGYFIVKNNTKNTIKYEKILIGCDCTSLYLNEGDSLLSGKIDTIRWSFSFEGLVKGEMKRHIRIVTNTDVDLNRFYIAGTIK